MSLRLKIVSVQPVALLFGHDHGPAAYPRKLIGALLHGGGASTRTKGLRGLTVAMALKEEEPESSRSRFAGGAPTWDPRMEIGVPYEQRPVNEYSALKDSTLYSWAELSPGSFFMRLGSLCLVTFTLLAAPISAASFSPGKDPLKFVLAAGIGTLLLVSLVVLRIYLGWSYVGDRLLSAVVPYEETGWYDGQMWVKPAEVLARDRLLGSYKKMSPMCEYCHDDSGRCNDPVLDEDTYFSLALRSGFKNHTCIPCFARRHICDKIHAHAFEETVTKEVKLKTKHFVLKVNIFNEPEATFFGCSKWDALCKTYAFDDNMKIAFNLGRRRRGTDVFRDDDISVELGDMIPVRSSSYVLAMEEVQKLVDNTFYNDGLDLSMNEQDQFIKVLKLLPSYANHFKAGPSFGPYVPVVLRLEDYMLKWPSLRIPQVVTPRWMLGLKGEVKIVCARPWSEPFKHDYNTESGTDGYVKIKAWRKIVVQKKPQPGDKLFSILYYGQFGRAFWFYFLSPSRVDSVLVVVKNLCVGYYGFRTCCYRS